MDQDLFVTFVTEAEEQVSELEQGLVALESQPGDQETIHRIFRAAHTLKSGAAMFGLEPVVSIAHVAESILARVRSRELAIDNELTTLLLSAADSFRATMAEAARNGPASREVAAVGQTAAHKKLLQGLQAYLPHAATGATVTLPKPAAGAQKSRIYDVDMRLDPKIMQRGMDPAFLLRDLTELGEVLRITTHLDTLPPLAEMDPVSCYVGWNVVLSSERPRDEIEGVFIFSSEDDRIKITDVTEGAGRRASLLPAEMKLGELLVEEGVVGERDVAVALGTQKRLGEVLVGLGKVTKESLARVLEKQVTARKTRSATTIRVDTDKLDKLVNLVGEMVIAVAQVTQTARDPAASEASRIASVETLDQISRDLQGQVMSVRMVPIEETFNRFHRATRDLARELGKLVVLEMDGTETELDKIVIEQLADPLKHMVRNALS